MPKRSVGSTDNKTALLHAIAHIEVNAIDLAWDIVSRFCHVEMPKQFYDDWVQVAVDEAGHFLALERRMNDLGAKYGDFPAHDGLWEAAVDTSDDLIRRLALVPMLFEARGLDTTPGTVARLRRHGDDVTAVILEKIAFEEISHVAAGVRWFEYLADKRGLRAVPTWRRWVAEAFPTVLKPPFNEDAREQAGMNALYYRSWGPGES